MYKQKFRYKFYQFLNRNCGTSLFESKSEEVFYNLAKEKGIKLKKQVRFTYSLPLLKRLLYKTLPILYKGYRCDFVYKRCVIEIDSIFHNKKYDDRRDQFMEMYGFEIYRVDWKDLYNRDGLKRVEKIIKKLVD